MPVPQDIHRHVIISRFQRRRHIAAGILALIVAAGAYIGFIVLNPPPASPGSLPVYDRIGIAVLVMLLAMLVVYVHYRCPNCKARSLGKAWLGINPTRCPSCKSSLK
jgi:purine-cytosine permease-like protein